MESPTEIGLDPKLHYFAKMVRRRLRQDWDMVIAVTGERGSGKSTLSKVMGYVIDPKFGLATNVAYIPTYKDIVKKFNALPQFSYFDVDEAIRAFYKMQFMNRLQQIIVQMYSTERYQNKATSLLIPRFWDLTENFRNNLVKIWVHVMGRGYAVAKVIDPDMDSPDPWHRKENYKRKTKGKKSVKRVTSLDIEQRIELEIDGPNYFTHFTFPDLPPYLRQEYIRLRQESRQKISLEKELTLAVSDREAKLRQSCINMIQYIKIFQPELTYDKMEQITGLASGTLTAYLQSDNTIGRKKPSRVVSRLDRSIKSAGRVD